MCQVLDTVRLWKHSTYFLREAGLWTIFQRAPLYLPVTSWCSYVSLQLLLDELHTLLAIRRENLDIISTSPSYSAGGSLLCALPGSTVDTCSASAPEYFWTVCPLFLLEGTWILRSIPVLLSRGLQSRSHLETGHYFHEPFASDSSSFAVQVLPEGICWEPSMANSCSSSRARVAQVISTICGHTHVALLSPCQKLTTTATRRFPTCAARRRCWRCAQSSQNAVKIEVERDEGSNVIGAENDDGCSKTEETATTKFVLGKKKRIEWQQQENIKRERRRQSM